MNYHNRIFKVVNNLLSIDDARLSLGTENLQDDWIVLVKQKRGK